MQKFLDSFKKHKYIYIILLAAITTVILINELFGFLEIIITKKFGLIYSAIIFLFLIFLSIKRRFWENEE